MLKMCIASDASGSLDQNAQPAEVDSEIASDSEAASAESSCASDVCAPPEELSGSDSNGDGYPTAKTAATRDAVHDAVTSVTSASQKLLKRSKGRAFGLRRAATSPGPLQEDAVARAQRRVQEQFAARRRARQEERRQKALGQYSVNLEAFRRATAARAAKDKEAASAPEAGKSSCVFEVLDGQEKGQRAFSKGKPAKQPKQRRRIAIVGAGPVGLWAANLIMLRHARRVRRSGSVAVGSGAAAAKAAQGAAFIRSKDAPEIVIFEQRAEEDHCSRRNVRITLDAHTAARLKQHASEVALLNKHTKSKRFESGMALADIESILLDQWRRLGGSNSIRFGSKTSPQDIAAEAEWDLILWAGGRRSLEDSTRSEMGCDMRLGESEEVLVFEMRHFSRGKGGSPVKIQELEQLAAVDLTFCARSAAAACAGSEQAAGSLSYRVVLRVAQDAATTPAQPLCWLWFMGLPEELKAAKEKLGRGKPQACESVVAALQAELSRLGFDLQESWAPQILAAAGALQEKLLSPAETTVRWVDASFWSSDHVVCTSPPGPSGSSVPFLLLGDAAMGKPFYTGTNLNVHFGEVKALSRLPVIRWGVGTQMPARCTSPFLLSSDEAAMAAYQPYEDRFQEVLTRTPGFKRSERRWAKAKTCQFA